MLRRDFIKATTLACGVSFLPDGLMAQWTNQIPNILLLGDSISIGYTKYVQDLLAGKAEVHRPLNAKGNPENCEGTTKGIANIDRWLGNTKWDVIHFNFGLHDLKHVDPQTGKNSTKPEDPQQADLKQYRKNLTDIVKSLEATGAKLIFATTTPYSDKPSGPLRRADQPQKYNAVALKIMKKHNIMIDDLYSLVLPVLQQLQQPNNVHFTREGSMFLAQKVVDSILKVI